MREQTQRSSEFLASRMILQRHNRARFLMPRNFQRTKKGKHFINSRYTRLVHFLKISSRRSSFCTYTFCFTHRPLSCLMFKYHHRMHLVLSIFMLVRLKKIELETIILFLQYRKFSLLRGMLLFIYRYANAPLRVVVGKENGCMDHLTGYMSITLYGLYIHYRILRVRVTLKYCFRPFLQPFDPFNKTFTVCQTSE